YLFLVGFFALLILQGLGLLKSLPMELLAQALLLVLFFWFQRERADKKPLEPKPPAEPEAPRGGARDGELTGRDQSIRDLAPRRRVRLHGRDAAVDGIDAISALDHDGADRGALHDAAVAVHGGHQCEFRHGALGA